MEIKNKRLAILTVTAIVVGIWYFLFIMPYSSYSINNLCVDGDAALQTYSTEKDTKNLEVFAKKRVASCKQQLNRHKNDKDIYKKMENCDLFAYAASASSFLVNLAVQNKDFSVAKEEIENARQYTAPYAYCPQHQSLQNLFEMIEKKHNL